MTQKVLTTVYRKDNCSQCRMTLKAMEKYDIHPLIANISDFSDDEIEGLKEKGMGHAPIVTFNYLRQDKGVSISKTGLWSGFQPDEIKKLSKLYKDGAKQKNRNSENQQLNKYCQNVTGITVFETYVVWIVKDLQNNKASLSTNIPDGRYYEVTHDGDKH